MASREADILPAARPEQTGALQRFVDAKGSLMPVYARLRTWVMLLTASGAALTAGCGSVRWEMDYARGMRRAVDQRRRALIQFHTGVSSDCREMDFKVFTNDKVRELVEVFVPIRVDLYLNRDLARRFGIEQVPAFVVIRPDGTVAGTHVGKLDEERFRVFLIKHRYN